MNDRSAEAFAAIQLDLEDARAFAKTALDQQRATIEVLQVINASPGDLIPVFDAIVSNALRLCDASFGGLFLVEGGTARPHGLFGGNVPQAFVDWLASHTVPVTHLLGRDPLASRYMHVADLATSEAYVMGLPLAIALVDLGGGRTGLNMPLIDSGTIIGILALSRQEVRPFSDKQIALLQAFAIQAQIAMKNARLMNETREALERQTATAEILKVIAESPDDVQPVFDAIAERARLLCGAQLGSATRFDGEWIHLLSYRGVSPEARRRCVPLFRSSPGMDPSMPEPS